ncbi:hypothetical protein P152DRAFT_471338 [Eremomyces bilateralis CBS 781.70]|uniref:Nucleolar protein 12 n=1 Tax=Eremomyces bilateralis CBS 781.70 TaxID=1392243 RepID=A0A6G1GD24_9PEZI|nr:uncharacterized protein P152DRAFT_471338 [Eremomyces bilateralis CBS 781.70]KAF1815978.1 hypothetical protein P152DRAFT_471338 [Eremomyces bilateralis CBS 781.70]
MGPPSKRRKVENDVEIVFDPTEREKYLTGFHKRKVERATKAREKAIEREKEELRQHRREIREERKRALVEHVNTVNTLIHGEEHGKNTNGTLESADEDTVPDKTGIVDSAQAEYEDDDEITTVTVDPVNVTRDGLLKIGSGEESGDEVGTHQKDGDDEDGDGKDGKGGKDGKDGKDVVKDRKRSRFARSKGKTGGGDKSLKTRKKRFRYESVGERAHGRRKEKQKKSDHAKQRRGK